MQLGARLPEQKQSQDMRMQDKYAIGSQTHSRAQIGIEAISSREAASVPKGRHPVPPQSSKSLMISSTSDKVGTVIVGLSDCWRLRRVGSSVHLITAGKRQSSAMHRKSWLLLERYWRKNMEC